MVDSIHQAGRIGVILPPGQLHKVGHRNQSRKDSREEGDTESQHAGNESMEDGDGSDQEAGESRSKITTPSGNSDKKRTGRRIDVRI